MQETQSESANPEPRKPQALPLSYWPSSVLSQPCLPIHEITQGIKDLAQDMIFTMLVYHGIGLAAPQVGQRLRMFVVDIDWVRGLKHANPHVFINPAIITVGSSEIDSQEGCLSFPGTAANLKRSERVIVRATDLNGEPIELECEGLMARAVQHENDHLNGVTINPHLSKIQRHELRKGLKIASRASKLLISPQR